MLGERGRSTHRMVDRAEKVADLWLVAAGRLELLRIWEDLMWRSRGAEDEGKERVRGASA